MLTPAYSFVDDDWAELGDSPVKERPEHGTHLPTAAKTEAAFVFRDERDVVHKYPFSGTGDIAYVTQYLNYLSVDEPAAIPLTTTKGMLVSQVLCCLIALARTRKKIRILEIGSTVGENYLYIKKLLTQYQIPLSVDFVGLESSPGLCHLAKVVHQGDSGFVPVTSDGGSLSRFPDRSFDLVICQGVANFTDAPMQTFRDIARITRFAFVLALVVTDDEEGFFAVEGGANTRHYIPARRSLYEAWDSYFPLHDYCFEQTLVSAAACTERGTDFYLGQDPRLERAFFESHTVARVRFLEEMFE